MFVMSGRKLFVLSTLAVTCWTFGGAAPTSESMAIVYSLTSSSEEFLKDISQLSAAYQHCLPLAPTVQPSTTVAPTPLPSAKPCKCVAKGDPHYKTFDGAHVELYEDCRYVMAASTLSSDPCQFRVEVKNQLHPSSRYSHHAFTQLVDVFLPSVMIRLDQGKNVTINGQPIPSIPYHTAEFNVSDVNGFVEVTSACGVQVQFDGNKQAHVTTPGNFRNKLRGLCGNCDADRKNDLRVNGKDPAQFGSPKNAFLALAELYLVQNATDGPTKSDKCKGPVLVSRA